MSTNNECFDFPRIGHCCFVEYEGETTLVQVVAYYSNGQPNVTLCLITQEGQGFEWVLDLEDFKPIKINDVISIASNMHPIKKRLPKEKPVSRKLEGRDEYLRPNEVAEYLGVTRTTIWRMQRDAGFPQPIKVGLRATAFRRSEVEEWLAKR